MITERRLIGIALIPLSATIIMYFVLQGKRYANASERRKQTVVGLVFGVIAIIATEFGVPMYGTIINVRDAAPLCAGLFFGPLAGIIAGIIGGVERWLCVYWGGGFYTRWACSISTVVVGFIAAYLKRNIFEGRNPDWFISLFIGFFCETFHMIMIFMTNLDNIKVAFDYVQACTLPMVLINSITVGLAGLLIHRIEKESLQKEIIPTISSQFQRSLSIVVVCGFILTTTMTYIIERQLSLIDTFNQMIDAIIDVYVDGDDRVSERMYRNAREIGEDYYYDLKYDISWLTDYYDVTETVIADNDGNVIDSSVEKYREKRLQDFDELRLVYEDIETMKEFDIDRAAIDNSGITSEREEYRKYFVIRFEDKIIIVSLNRDKFEENMDYAMKVAINYHKVGDWGALMVVKEDGTIYSDLFGYTGRNISELDLSTKEPDYDSYIQYETRIGEIDYYYTLIKLDNYTVYAFYERTEADFAKIQSTMMNFFMQTMAFGILFVVIYYVTKRRIVNNIKEVNSSLDKITEGQLDTVVDVRNNEEFISLSDGINTTVDSLKHFIKEANERIDSELKYAKEIQFSSLQTEFPAFPDHDEFDLYAIMDPAKVVGGDFYDFYMIDEESLVFLVADVSGKSIPASLFMMRAKTMIRNYVETEISLGEVLTKANSRLCEGNDAGMFVTTWIGDLDLKTGELRYANAGHNLPLLKKKDGSFEYLKIPAGFVLAGMDGIKYKEQSLTMEPGDELFVYSDGVVEATNLDKELYGDDRLRECLNDHPNETAQQLCESVITDVRAFYDGAEQFDDITELSLKFLSYKK